MGISRIVTFHHIAIPDVTFREIYPDPFDDEINIGVDSRGARVLVIKVGDLMDNDDQAAFIQDGELLVGLGFGAEFTDDRALGNKPETIPVELFQRRINLARIFAFSGMGTFWYL